MQEEQRTATKLLQGLQKERNMATESILLNLIIKFDYYKIFDRKLDTSSSYVCYLFYQFQINVFFSMKKAIDIFAEILEIQINLPFSCGFY